MNTVVQGILLSGFLISTSAAMKPTLSGNDFVRANAVVETIVKAPGNPDDYLYTLPVDQFTKIDKFSGDRNYYEIITSDSGLEYIHSHYVPSAKVVRYGYIFPDTLRNVKRVSWSWRIITPPAGADERIKGLNDSGCAVYLIFKDKIKTYCIKYVYSSVVPQGTIIRKETALYPMQQMYTVVADTWGANEKGLWKKVDVDICSDFKRIYKDTKCPELKGVGILSDGDGTKSEVVADYADFNVSGEK